MYDTSAAYPSDTPHLVARGMLQSFPSPTVKAFNLPAAKHV